jgi:hypothetical protein
MRTFQRYTRCFRCLPNLDFENKGVEEAIDEDKNQAMNRIDGYLF